MGNRIVARPGGAVAEHDDFAVQEFDTGGGAGARRPQVEIAPYRAVVERPTVDFAKCERNTERRGTAL
jgi:hypothetical protein